MSAPGVCEYPGCQNALLGYRFCADHCETTPCPHGEADWHACEACVQDEYDVRRGEREADR